MSISPPARASEARRFGNAQAIVRCARAGATSIAGKDFLPVFQKRPDHRMAAQKTDL
jgi:hypothetical protein